MIELLLILGTVIATSVVWFLVWRNNKKKFIQTIIDIDSLIDLSYTREELEAELDKVLAQLKSELIAKAKEELNKL